MSLKQVKTKIRSIEKTRQVTKAMEAVSAVKMRKSQERALLSRPYALSALTILQNVSGSIDGIGNPLAVKKEKGKTCFIVVTSDRGLAGSLNSSIFKEYVRFEEKYNLDKDNIGIVTIGRRAREYFSKRSYNVLSNYEGWGDRIDFSNVKPLVEEIRGLFLDEGYKEVYIVYTNFISTLEQKVYIRSLLPLSFSGLGELVSGILPEKGKYSEAKTENEVKTDVFTFEPSREVVLLKLLPLLLNIQVYHSVLEANASEHSARMIAMKNASDNAISILKDLRLSYNKARQAAITREVSEIVAGTLV